MTLALAPTPAPPVERAPARSSRVHPECRFRAPVRSAAVCIPARNEAKRLPETLYALSRAVEQAQRKGIVCHVAIALDGCTDGSGALLRAVARTFPCEIVTVALPAIGISHAGRARRAAMDLGLEIAALGQCEGQQEAHAVMTTDADTTVNADWIVANTDGLAETDLVAGYVEWDSETPVPELVYQEAYFDALHRWRRRIDPVAFDADSPHHKQYGASLAVRGDVYADLGGLPVKPCNEDTELVRRARLAGYRVRQDREPKVLTSTRRKGRAEGGFSDAIQWVENLKARGGQLEVDCPDVLTESYRASARARQAFSRSRSGGRNGATECGHIPAKAGVWGNCVGTSLPESEFEQAWAVSPSADSFVTRLFERREPQEAQAAPKVPLDRAVERLATLMERGVDL